AGKLDDGVAHGQGGVDPIRAQGNVVSVLAAVDHQRVIAGTAIDRVVAVAGVPDDGVVAVAAQQGGVAQATDDGVVAATAVDGEANDRSKPGGVDGVVAASSLDDQGIQRRLSAQHVHGFGQAGHGDVVRVRRHLDVLAQGAAVDGDRIGGTIA